MDLAEFEDLVDRLGEDISAWPEPARTDARSLLAQSQEAREVLAAAHDMRVGLGRDQTVRAPAGLVDRIMHQAHLESPPATPTAPAQPFFAFRLADLVVALRPAILLPLCFMIGLVVGLLPANNPTSGAAIELPSLFQGCCGDRSAH